MVLGTLEPVGVNRVAQAPLGSLAGDVSANMLHPICKGGKLTTEAIF
jgi:hypothetical protein